MSTSPTPSPSPTSRDRRGRVYTPAVGRNLRPWLWIVLIGFSLLLANGVYLASVTAMTYLTGVLQQTPFYQAMVMVHLGLGILIIVPFLIFGFAHLFTSWKRPNKSAINYGLILLAAAMAILVTGLLLFRIEGLIDVRDPNVRKISYWTHVALPLVAIALYIKHRLAGPMIRWKWAKRGGLIVTGFVAVMAMLHAQEPLKFGVKGPREGSKYFFPSEAVTSNGKFIPASVLMADSYCLKCHQDAYKGWYHSSHHFSSFNNKAYLTSVRETRKVSLERDGNAQAARWCAGCHDPVPFFSGEFDDPNYDDVNNPTSQAGITCTACHSITNINSTRGNADYTIEEPQHYPFAFSENKLLQWVNNALVKAKPEMHKRTFLKPLIKDSKFCSTCHKVGLPYALNHYKDFLRGQNHWDTFLLSGVSGHGARSFYYPPVAKGQCVNCHMNFIASTDFGAQDFDGKPGREIHNHLFLGANTGLATMRGRPDIAEQHAKYLQDQKVRIDIFALREGGEIEGAFLGPLRPEVPTLKAGKPYLVETVVRTLAVGHPLTQGTVDSNEIWVELIVKQGDKIIGRSGGIDDKGTVDPYAHFINVYMLDREGKRIDRRNAQDIFVPLYNKQIPPGAGQVVHFALETPKNVTDPITIEAQVNYRKFDRKYFDYLFGDGRGPVLPVTVMAKDAVTLPIEGGAKVTNPDSPIKEVWQRWNDYGIGLLLEGTEKGGQKGELKQAEPVFQKVADLGKADGFTNLARVYIREGRIPDALAALDKASKHKEPAAPWVIAWLSAQIDETNGFFDEAILKYESVLATKIPDRGIDLSYDYEVNNALGVVLYSRSRLEDPKSPERLAILAKTAKVLRHTLSIDAENVAAHYNLGLAYGELGADATPSTEPVPTKVEPADIEDIAKKIADAKTTPADRAKLAASLNAKVAVFLSGERPSSSSRLSPLIVVVDQLNKAFLIETDATLQTNLAATLATTHKALHTMFKPDELAEGRAIGTAVKDNPAADQNARSVVIHPLHRPGAPGINAKPVPVAAREVK
jgi:tetratricopeptide (TPR) repeat protein